MPSVLFNSQQRRRVLALSFRIVLHTTYVRHSPETHTDTRYTLILIDNTVGSKLTTADTQTVTESSKHSDRINISFYGHKRNPYQIKGVSLLHSSTHAYAHTSHSQRQAEGGGMQQYNNIYVYIFIHLLIIHLQFLPIWLRYQYKGRFH